MRHANRLTLGGLGLAALLLVGCTPQAEAAPPPAVKVEKIEGTDLSRLTLSPQAAQRLGLETAQVTSGAGWTVVPYAAVLYDLDGATWVYTNPADLEFVRHAITIDRITGDRALLTDGPPIGTRVVTVGVAELHGAEAGIGGGH